MIAPRKHSLNDISKKDFRVLCRDGNRGNILVENYARRILNRANSANSSNLFTTVFGDYWYEQSYSKLYQLAKLTSVKGKDVSKQYIDISKADVMGIRKSLVNRNNYKASSLANICKKFYKKSEIDKIIESSIPTLSFFGNTHGKLTALVLVAARVRKYAPKELKRLKQADRTQLEALLNNAGVMGKITSMNSYYYRRMQRILTKSDLENMQKQYIEAVLDAVLGENEAERIMGNIKESLLDKALWRLESAGCEFGCPDSVYQQAAVAMQQVERFEEVYSMLNELDLNICPNTVGLYYRAKKVSTKLYKLLKQLKAEYENGTPLKEVQQVAVQFSKTVLNRSSQSVFEPALAVKESK